MEIKSVLNKSLSLVLALVILITSAAVIAPAQAKIIRSVCTNCNGKGYYVCKACSGSGKSKYWDLYDHVWKYYACPACNGHRTIKCPRCQNGYEVIDIPEPKPTSIKKIVPKAVGFTVSWKRQTVQTAGYEVQYATDSKFKKNKDYELISGNANTSVSISGLKANTKYYVRVRSYKSAYGRRYSSSWSGVKSVVTKKLAKPAPTSISKIVSKSAAFTVSWKKQTKNTTGYQIQYSTKSNFKNNKNKSVKNKTSLTISGLKGKTKYYVRVRTYRTFGGKNYYSAWSKAKSVTTKAAATFVTIKAETYAAQVSDIYNNPSKYLGKKIQIDGLYDLEDLTSQNGGTYYYVYRLIHGAPGEEDSMCGFEFTTADGKYPSYVPKNGDTNSDHPWIRVTGILQVYYEGEGNNKTAYFTLSKATCQVMNERGAEYI